MDTRTIALLLAGTPLAIGAVGAGIAYASTKKNEHFANERLRASARDVLTPANFGKNLEYAQQEFLQLAAIAPKSMQMPNVAKPLLMRAVKSKNDAETFTYATNLERNLADISVRQSMLEGQAMKAFNTGIMAGQAAMPLLNLAYMPQPTHHGHHGAGAPTAPVIDDNRAASDDHIANFVLATKKVNLTPEEYAAEVKDIQNMSPVEKHNYISTALNKTRTLFGMLDSGEMIRAPKMKKESSMNAASHEAMGDIIGTQYCLCKFACEQEKLSYDMKTVIENTLLTAASAGLLAGGSMAAHAGYTAYKENKAQKELESSFNTTINRLQKNVSTDPMFEAARNKLISDPVTYRMMAREAFDVLSTTSPEMAKHPIVARHFITNVINNEGSIPTTDVGNFARIQDSIHSHRMPQESQFNRAFNTFGGTAALSTGMGEVIRGPGAFEEAERGRAHAGNIKAMDIASRVSEGDIGRKHQAAEGHKNRLSSLAIESAKMHHGVGLSDHDALHKERLSDRQHRQSIRRDFLKSTY